MNKKIVIFSALVVVYCSVFAQNKYRKLSVIDTPEFGKASFISDSVIIKSSSKANALSPRSTPEEQLQVLLSVDSLRVYNSLYKDNMGSLTQEELSERKNIKRDSLYAHITNKLLFKYQGNDFCVIKYYTKSPGNKKTSSALIMEKVKDRWYFTTDSIVDYYSSTFFIFKPKHLSEIFVDHRSQNAILDGLIKEAVVGTRLDLKTFVRSYLVRLRQNKRDLAPLWDSF
ncbi:MAG TPA: hypothetical protein VL947_05470 [Cytophagales bacterium]|nr:hypothetical protein [Cytophagales bacterium]